MRAFISIVGAAAILAAAHFSPASAQQRRRYEPATGERCHVEKWDFLTVNTRSLGVHWEEGINIYDDPTPVCGHDGDYNDEYDGEDFYCNPPARYEWVTVPCDDPVDGTESDDEPPSEDSEESDDDHDEPEDDPDPDPDPDPEPEPTPALPPVGVAVAACIIVASAFRRLRQSAETLRK